VSVGTTPVEAPLPTVEVMFGKIGAAVLVTSTPGDTPVADPLVAPFSEVILP
jgi:hypothetical protein